jgi:CheY-like chemotaxis protein
MDEKNREYNFHDKTILLVEDDYNNSYYFTELLSYTGANVISAESGEKAIELASSLKPDLVLLDIGLPDMTGYEVAERMRHKNPNIKIIALTAYALEDERQKVINAGFNDFVSKPTTSAILLKVINKHLTII